MKTQSNIRYKTSEVLDALEQFGYDMDKVYKYPLIRMNQFGDIPLAAFKPLASRMTDDWDDQDAIVDLLLENLTPIH